MCLGTPLRSVAQISEEVDPWQVEEIGFYETDSVELEPVGDSLKSTFSTDAQVRIEEPPNPEVIRSPAWIGQKFRWQDRRNLTLGLSYDKDPGEKHLYDHTSLTAELPLSGTLHRLIVGDFLVNYGSGLLLRTARSYGVGSASLLDFAADAKGCKPYAGWDESRALRGAALEVDGGKWSLSTWGSSRYREATLDSSDAITSFGTSGLHRTVSEEAKQEAGREDVWGLHGEYHPRPRWHLGASFYSLSWNKRFELEGAYFRKMQLGNLEFQIKSQALRSGFELAMDDQLQTSQLIFLSYSQGIWQGSCSVFRLGTDYFSPLAQIYDLEQEEVRNRLGLHLKLNHRQPSYKIAGFAHFFRPLERQDDDGKINQDIKMTIKYFVNEKIEMSISSRYSSKWVDLNPHRSPYWRGSASLRLEPFKDTYLEGNGQFCQNLVSSNNGQLLILGIERHLILWSSNHLNLGLHLGQYRSSTYAERLFWTDPDFSNYLRVYPLWDQGGILCLSLNARLPQYGQVGISAVWDEPHASSERSPERSLTLVYRYPSRRFGLARKPPKSSFLD